MYCINQESESRIKLYCYITHKYEKIITVMLLMGFIKFLLLPTPLHVYYLSHYSVVLFTIYNI